MNLIDSWHFRCRNKFGMTNPLFVFTNTFYHPHICLNKQTKKEPQYRGSFFYRYNLHHSPHATHAGAGSAVIARTSTIFLWQISHHRFGG